MFHPVPKVHILIIMVPGCPIWHLLMQNRILNPLNYPVIHPSMLKIQFCLFQSFDLTKYDREGCNQLLMAQGFYKKATEEEEVPEEYQQGPYEPKQEL